MSNIIEYFSSVGKGIVSLVKGMQVTGKELVTKKITECYPENRDNLNISDRFRAVLTLRDVDGHHKCIGCGICQMNCPNGTITLQTKMVDLPDGKKKKVLDKYMYDLCSCTFCMLCVTTCPRVPSSSQTTSSNLYSRVRNWLKSLTPVSKIRPFQHRNLVPPLPPQPPNRPLTLKKRLLPKMTTLQRRWLEINPKRNNCFPLLTEEYNSYLLISGKLL